MKNRDASQADESMETQEATHDLEDTKDLDFSPDDPEAISPSEDEDDAASLDSLLYEDDDQVYEPETTEESLAFEDFLNQYKAHISQTIHQETAEEPIKETADKEIDSQEDKNALKKVNSNITKIKAESNESDWSDEITLVPEVYEAPDEDENVFRDTVMPEEEPNEEEFSIGTELYHAEDDEIQISIRFDESESEISEPDKAPTEYKYNPEKPRIIDSVYDFLELFVITLISVMILTTFVFKHSVVDGDSMNNTLEDGDSLIISNLFVGA